jgi:hypothetical protein
MISVCKNFGRIQIKWKTLKIRMILLVKLVLECGFILDPQEKFYLIDQKISKIKDRLIFVFLINWHST